MKYKINELTPKEMSCPLAWPCPAIYEVEEASENNKEKTK